MLVVEETRKQFTKEDLVLKTGNFQQPGGAGRT
jgi:hypothetical protein